MSEHKTPSTCPEDSRSRRIERRQRRRRQVQALLAGCLVLGVGATATVAAWNDDQGATGQFHAGQFQIEANIDGTWASTGQMRFESDLMFPGQDVYAPVFIRTSPETTFHGKLTVSASDVDGPLAEYLNYRVVADTFTKIPQNFRCDGTRFNTDIESYIYDSPDGPDVSMSDLIASEETRTVSAGSADVVAYCFHVQLSAEVPNSMQGQSARHTWTWNAESLDPS